MALHEVVKIWRGSRGKLCLWERAKNLLLAQFFDFIGDYFQWEPRKIVLSGVNLLPKTPVTVNKSLERTKNSNLPRKKKVKHLHPRSNQSYEFGIQNTPCNQARRKNGVNQANKEFEPIYAHLVGTRARVIAKSNLRSGTEAGFETATFKDSFFYWIRLAAFGFSFDE